MIIRFRKLENPNTIHSTKTNLNLVRVSKKSILNGPVYYPAIRIDLSFKLGKLWVVDQKWLPIVSILRRKVFWMVRAFVSRIMHLRILERKFEYGALALRHLESNHLTSNLHNLLNSWYFNAVLWNTCELSKLYLFH